MRGNATSRASNEPTFNHLTVTIGRNTQFRTDGPPGVLLRNDWQRFQTAVRVAVAEHVNASDHETHYGHAEWQGVAEESAALSFRTDPASEFTAGVVANLTRDLGSVAATYGQDAIAVAYGWVTLAYSPDVSS